LKNPSPLCFKDLRPGESPAKVNRRGRGPSGSSLMETGAVAGVVGSMENRRMQKLLLIAFAAALATTPAIAQDSPAPDSSAADPAVSDTAAPDAADAAQAPLAPGDAAGMETAPMVSSSTLLIAGGAAAAIAAVAIPLASGSHNNSSSTTTTSGH
jgi:hypothetical protein